MSVEEFNSEIIEQVELMKEKEGFGWEENDFFTSIYLDYMEDLGEVDSPIICPYRDAGVELNAYVIDEEYENLELYVSIYNPNDDVETLGKNEVDAALKRCMQVYRRASNDLYKLFEKDSDTYEFAYLIYQNKTKFKQVKITLITNYLIDEMKIDNVEVENTIFSFDIWDINRLCRCISTGKLRETIEIDFDEFDDRIYCLENKNSDSYDAYLAMIPGNILAHIYTRHGARLLEKNVRSFLQVKGAVNKGIKNTLKTEPDMFLAYNNGISVTAESIEVKKTDDGQKYISKIRDMQIVNGGQTTASIYNITREKNSDVDLSKVFVQMKISVVESNDKMEEVVHRISECANTQNKIQMADFSSNDPFNRKMEELSRTIWTPETRDKKSINWFFERARGQYLDELSKLSTPTQKKHYKEDHPLFTKTDLAKYENAWNQMPYFVSEGAQKNFKRFMVALKERGNFLPDEKYYQQLIAKAILYKRVETIVQNQKFGGYRANIVAYTIALISYKSAQRIDLERIWNNQSLTNNLEVEIERVSHLVHEFITNPPGGANISEYCKKKTCWESIVQMEYEMSNDLKSELVVGNGYTTVVSKNSNARKIFNSATDEEKELIDRIVEIPAETWLAISKWAKDTNNLQTWQRGIAFSVGSIIGRGKKPSVKQAKQAEIIYSTAKDKGFFEV